MMDIVDSRQRITRWLRGMWAGSDQAARPDRVALRHVSASDRQIDVATFELPLKDVEKFELEGLLSRIEEAIENDVDGLGGVQKYVLHAMREGRPLSRLPLRAASARDEAGAPEALETEPSTGKGLLGQLMRHNEVQSRLLAMSMGQNVSQMQRTIARLQEANERCEEKLLASLEICEEMLTRDHERKVLTQMVEDNRTTQTMIMDGVKEALPHLFRFLSQGAAGEAPPAVAVLIRKLYRSLRPDQVGALSRLLTAEQMDLLRTLFGSQAVDEDDETGGRERAEPPARAPSPGSPGNGAP